MNKKWDEIGKNAQERKLKNVLKVIAEHSEQKQSTYAFIMCIENTVVVKVRTQLPIENWHVYDGCMRMDSRGGYSIYNFGEIANCSKIMDIFNKKYGGICEITYRQSYETGYEVRSRSWTQEVINRTNESVKERSQTIG